MLRWALPLLCLLCCLISSAQTDSARNPWTFASFGPHATGTIKYEKKKLRISTQNTLHCFAESDTYSFAWQKQSFPYDDCSKSTAAVTIAAFSKGAAGIMMRSDTRPGAANVHLEISATGDIILFCRKSSGGPTAYTHLANTSFPVQLKLVRQGAVFTAYYKDRNSQWIKGGSMMADTGAEFLAGFYGCSGDEPTPGLPLQQHAPADFLFTDWTFDYEEQFIPAEKNYTDAMPVKAGTLLRDNFNDGSLSNTPASITNPIWKGIRYGYLPYGKAGDRYWRKTGDGVFDLGDKKWGDYEVSLDLAFDTGAAPSAEFTLQLRRQDISVYSSISRYYSLILRNGNRLLFEKYDPGGISGFSKSIVLPAYFDGSIHNIKVRLMDRDYEVYYDNKKILSGTDSIQPITYGNISLRFANVAMNIDNLEVLSIDDPVNGAIDNYLRDYFDTPIPMYLKKYGFSPTGK